MDEVIRAVLHINQTANFGVGFVISADSGQVPDYGFLSKICVQCSRKNQKRSEESDEFRTWYASHSPCAENHAGSSGAMEKEIARIWSNSLSYNLRYKFMICDDDSKAHNGVWDIYGSSDDCSNWEDIDKKVMNTRSEWPLMLMRSGNMIMTLAKQIVQGS